jgi:hypothetical protein
MVLVPQMEFWVTIWGRQVSLCISEVSLTNFGTFNWSWGHFLVQFPILTGFDWFWAPNTPYATPFLVPPTRRHVEVGGLRLSLCIGGASLPLTSLWDGP